MLIYRADGYIQRWPSRANLVFSHLYSLRVAYPAWGQLVGLRVAAAAEGKEPPACR